MEFVAIRKATSRWTRLRVLTKFALRASHLRRLEKKLTAQEEYNETVVALGSWIDKDFLEDILGDGITVDSHEIKAAVGPGDNYLGILYRTTANYHTQDSPEGKTAHLMVKGRPTGEYFIKVIEENDIFIKEVSIYNRFLPAMKLVADKYFPNDDFFAPNGLKSSRPETIVMEDLAIKGYRMASRVDQLDYDHCALTLRTLARLHALSVKLNETEPDIIQEIAASEFFQEYNKELMAPAFQGVMHVFAGELETWKGHEKTADDVREISENVWDKVVAMFSTTENFNAIIHGDLWTNNIMYKYDDNGHVTSVKMVDYQFARYTTPAMDLIYFLLTSPRPEVLSTQMFELIEVYYDALTEDLAVLGLDVDFPLYRLHQDIRERATFGFTTLAFLLPMMVVQPEDAGVFNDGLDTVGKEAEGSEVEATEPENPLLAGFRNPIYVKLADNILNHFDSVGLIDDAKQLTPKLTAKQLKSRKSNA